MAKFGVYDLENLVGGGAAQADPDPQPQLAPTQGGELVNIGGDIYEHKTWETSFWEDPLASIGQTALNVWNLPGQILGEETGNNLRDQLMRKYVVREDTEVVNTQGGVETHTNTTPQPSSEGTPVWSMPWDLVYGTPRPPEPERPPGGGGPGVVMLPGGGTQQQQAGLGSGIGVLLLGGLLLFAISKG